MLLLLTAVQTFLPLGLLVWLAAAPLESVVGRWLQLVATGLVLIALPWNGIWILPPWWTPYLFSLLWIAACARTLMQWRSPRPFLPQRWKEQAGAAVFLLLGGYAIVVSVDAYGGRTPSGEVIDPSLPLRGGPYLVISGGSTKGVNAHMLTLNPLDDKMAAYRGQSFAVDLVRIDGFGSRSRGIRPRNPSAYHIFGDPLHAPCDGAVLHAKDGHPDLEIPETDPEHMAGNHVLLACGDAVVLMAHLQRNSVAVDAGESIGTGDRIGAVGNSGSTSEPHLHIHAQRAGTPDASLSGEPLQIRLSWHYLVRNDRVTAD